MPQVRLAVQSNAGGSGKTTTAVHLAYELGAKGYKVVILEVDPSGSIKRFVGLNRVLHECSLAKVILDTQFNGNYPIVPVWEDRLSTVGVVQGGKPLEQVIQLLPTMDEGKSCLRNRLEDYPLDADVVILDTPATLEPLGAIALACATHVLMAIKPEYKDADGSAEFLSWFTEKVRGLRLNPPPKLLGILPVRVDLGRFATHRNILGLEPARGKGTKRYKVKEGVNPADTLPGQAERMGFKCFPPVRESADYLNASGVGLPIHLYRPGAEATKDFQPIVAEIVKLLKEK